ncbi:hypothetical protein [Streptomyces sp. A5-4]|uniref:hypothetical protein n=1 Tax=Streptomyces sp. A5-4 TaxID=3384771 RepID=UPI003DAA3CA2
MAYEIQSGQGVDVARFGEGREELRRRLGEHASFRRTPASSPVDHYVEKGLQLSFDKNDALEFIELTPLADVRYEGISLLGRPYGEVLAGLRERGLQGVEDGEGIEFPELGFALFVSDPDDLEEDVQGVSVFPEGYY